MELILVLATLVVAVGTVAALGRYSTMKQRRQSPAGPTGLTATQRTDVNDMVNLGRTIQAIKTLRQHTGMSLADAKRAIDSWDPHQSDNLAPEPASSPDPRHAMPPEAVTEVDTLIAEGKNIQAVKVLRNATGWGLAEAKKAVDTWN